MRAMKFRALFARAMRRLRLRHGVHVFRIYLRPLGQAARIPCPDDVSVRLLEEGEVLAHCADPRMDLREAQVRGAFARGNRCLGAFIEGRLVGYNWLAYGPTPHLGGVWARFGEALRYSYKTYVHPDFRGRRIAQALHAFADDPALREGKRYALNFVDIDNLPSFAALERSGSRIAGYAGYLLWCGRMIAFRSPGASRHGFAFYRPGASAPTQRIAPIASESRRPGRSH